MVSSWLLCRVALVRTDVSEEPSASFIRVTIVGELRTTLAATSNRRTLRRDLYFFAAQLVLFLVHWFLSPSETSVLTRATLRNIPEDTILQARLVIWPWRWRLISLRIISLFSTEYTSLYPGNTNLYFKKWIFFPDQRQALWSGRIWNVITWSQIVGFLQEAIRSTSQLT
jgi:hypothetical protein